MFNPRQYGIAQGSLIAKSIHQEDLQCNESSVNNRRKPLPPKVASANAFGRGRGRGGRGVGRGGRGFATRGMNSHRGGGGGGGGVGNFASSRAFHKSLSQIPNLPSPSTSSAPTMISNEVTTRPEVSGITYNASSTSSHPRSSQPQAWKGKAVSRRAAQDENPRPTKRLRMDDAFEQSYTSAPDTTHSPRFLSAGDAVSTPAAAKNVRPRNLPSSQLHSGRLPPHIPTKIAISTIEHDSSTTPPGQSQGMKRKREVFQNEKLGPAETQSILPSKLDTKAPFRTFAINPALPPAVKAVSSYRPPQMPKAATSMDERPNNVLSDNINANPPYISTTHASSSPTSSAMPSLSSMRSPPYATQETMSQYEVPLCLQPKSIELASTTSLSLVPRSSDTQPVPSTLTAHVKKELPSSLPVVKTSPIASPLAPVKTENEGSSTSLADDPHVSAKVTDVIVIKQEPDPSEPIIPQRKLVTESCSFYPIPQNCRKSAPNYKDNRVEYFRKEYKRLREFGLTKQKVVFRDDGLAIEWTSPVPVWSDTLLPEVWT
ncbi:hypothetical protein AGABI2DRAFT_179080 [Agaricus bisporus var. bisporus H97]|uniref:hypothetical protein n=1 Tax=Agaricus bisporus var. bisporus (strain H97 / ATCC MYA-4626 / FGSC 10389) TaxID=936046 RepID=UPI00029F7566|nr:hypothetical protein AGABI2DRAFT_179080 [Agaricus bisporus var. bisporus H97]EKV46921.1 hypothetical protein AGABI2DRAFT_179080 [Agaricus bisporus var. bisporus H97]